MLPRVELGSIVQPRALLLIAAPTCFGGRRRCIFMDVRDPTDYIEEAAS